MPANMYLAGFRLPMSLKDVANVATLSVFPNKFFIFLSIIRYNFGCPALERTAVNELGKGIGYAAVFNSPLICLMAFFTFHPFSYRAIMNLLPFSVQTVYEFVPVEPSERVKVLVRVSWSFHAE